MTAPAAASTRPGRRRHRRRRLDDRCRRVQRLGTRPPTPPGPGSSSAWSSPPSSPSATPPRRPSWPPCTPSRAAPTCTPAGSSVPVWGHLAGWGFIVGKTASCVAIALTAGAYLWPDHARLVGVAAVAVVAIVNIGGLTRTVAVTKCLLAVALTALAAVVVAGWSSPTTRWRGSRRSTRHPPDVLRAGRVPVLRVRRLRPDRHARRGGPRPRHHHPQGDPPGSGRRAGDLRRRRRHAPGHRSRRRDRRERRTARPRRPGSRFDWLAPIVSIGAGIAALGVLLNLIPGHLAHRAGDGPSP